MNDENLNYFVSCFTYDVNESIPLWHMYSKGPKGIRIQVKNRNLFSGDAYFKEAGNEVYFFEEPGGSYTKDGKTVILKRRVITKENGVIVLSKVNGVKVYYNNKEVEEKFVEDTVQGNYKFKAINSYKMTGLKMEAWDFEKEARFFVTLTSNERNINSIYLTLSDDFFNDMIVTINPFLSDEDYNIKKNEIESLTNGYSIKIKKSELFGKIAIR